MAVFVDEIFVLFFFLWCIFSYHILCWLYVFCFIQIILCLGTTFWKAKSWEIIWFIQIVFKQWFSLFSLFLFTNNSFQKTVSIYFLCFERTTFQNYCETCLWLTFSVLPLFYKKQVSSEISPICSKLLATAQLCLSSNDKYLQSTMKLLREHLGIMSSSSANFHQLGHQTVIF